MSPVDVDHFRTVLLEERKRVAEAMQYIQDEHPDNDDEMAPDNHLADSAAVTLDQELDETLEENSSHVLTAIDEALERIEAGTFGICVNCGKEIPPERLEALPYATLCIDCKRIGEPA
ncbi:MAG: TraR/DksA C4-type zinc finger protein [Actinobacteria bacterium]|nr:TraR/DksA C4-type zinc finger protein [Actinomycetota bacterium]